MSEDTMIVMMRVVATGGVGVFGGAVGVEYHGRPVMLGLGALLITMAVLLPVGVSMARAIEQRWSRNA